MAPGGLLRPRCLLVSGPAVCAELVTRGLDLLLAFRGLLGDDQLDPDELRVVQSVLKGFEANQIEFDHADASANRPESFQSTFSQLRK